ncbi:hypothetical protein O0537_08460, partial [Dickeya solani]
MAAVTVSVSPSTSLSLASTFTVTGVFFDVGGAVVTGDRCVIDCRHGNGQGTGRHPAGAVADGV